MVKVCSSCLVVKDIEDYPIYTNGNPKSRCRDCSTQYMRQYRQTHPNVVAVGRQQSRERNWINDTPELLAEKLAHLQVRYRKLNLEPPTITTIPILPKLTENSN